MSNQSSSSPSCNKDVQTAPLGQFPSEIYRIIATFIPEADLASVFLTARHHPLSLEALHQPRQVTLGDNAETFMEKLLCFPDSPLCAKNTHASTAQDDSTRIHNDELRSESASAGEILGASNPAERRAESVASAARSSESLLQSLGDDFVKAVIQRKEVRGSTWSILPHCKWVDILKSASRESVLKLRTLARFCSSREELGHLFPGLEYQDSVRVEYTLPLNHRWGFALYSAKASLLSLEVRNRSSPDTQKHFQEDARRIEARVFAERVFSRS